MGDFGGMGGMGGDGGLGGIDFSKLGGAGGMDMSALQNMANAGAGEGDESGSVSRPYDVTGDFC